MRFYDDVSPACDECGSYSQAPGYYYGMHDNYYCSCECVYSAMDWEYGKEIEEDEEGLIHFDGKTFDNEDELHDYIWERDEVDSIRLYTADENEADYCDTKYDRWKDGDLDWN